MASICGISFSLLNLASDGAGDQGMQLEDITRTGTNGKRYRQIGERPGTSSYTSLVGFSSASGRSTAIDSYRASKGTTGQLVKEDGTTKNVIVLDVRITDERTADVVVGLDGKYILGAMWELEVLS